MNIKLDAKFLFFGAPLFFYFPFIINGVLYRDDINRATENFTYWSWLGRPVSDLIWKVLSLGGQGPL
ncbi:TPA: hypothetical protein N6656_003788, partial [Escherichia coli]|nr:hypothetical protein [Escherichia coli]